MNDFLKFDYLRQLRSPRRTHAAVFTAVQSGCSSHSFPKPRNCESCLLEAAAYLSYVACLYINIVAFHSY